MILLIFPIPQIYTTGDSFKFPDPRVMIANTKAYIGSTACEMVSICALLRTTLRLPTSEDSSESSPCLIVKIPAQRQIDSGLQAISRRTNTNRLVSFPQFSVVVKN